MTDQRTFEKTKKSKKKSVAPLRRSTMAWTFCFDQTNYTGWLLGRNTIGRLSFLFWKSNIWWNTTIILECERECGSHQCKWFPTIINWYSM